VIFLSAKAKKKITHLFAFLICAFVIAFIFNNAAKLVFPVKFKEYVIEYSEKNNIDPNLVFAIIKAESNFNPRAVSHKNARGLMQISEITGSWGAERVGIKNYNSEMLFDPEINIRIGCWYLGTLMNEYSGRVDLVIAAYNGGSGNVNRWLKDENYSSTGTSLDKIPFKETERYVKKVKNNYMIYKGLYE
jgi:soluble lytic murein transglycosylase